jgi:2-keto-4-pentenoate hydratase
MPCTIFRKSFSKAACALLGAALLAAPASAADLYQLPKNLTQHFISQTPVPGPAPALSMRDAMAVQGMVVNSLSRALGPPIGYKAGLTGAAAQQRFGVDEPLRGVILKRMVLADGATLPANFGARPHAEADLIVRVASATINEATTKQEALAALGAVIPFVELPDLMYAKGTALDGPAIAAINVGARYGVAGEPIAIKPGGDWLKRLGAMTVNLSSSDGSIDVNGEGGSLMGHPLNVVLWLVQSLNKDGVRLMPGDLLSLGSLTSLVPITGATTLIARYDKLDPAKGPVTVTVHISAP